MSSIVWLAAGIAGIYVVLAAGLYVFQERMIFLPSRQILFTPADAGIHAEDVYFQSANGKKLHGWFAETDPDAVTILFSHGNAGNISGRVRTMQLFTEAGYNVLLYDYQGYGKSEGRPGETEVLEDGLAAWDFLVNERGILEDRILPVGRSLGGSVAIHIALHRNAKAVALESTFTSVPDVAAKYYRIFPVKLLARVRLEIREKVEAFDGAILIAHSPADELIPYAMGRELYETADVPKMWLEMRGNHNEGYAITGDAYMNTYNAFIREVFNEGL